MKKARASKKPARTRGNRAPDPSQIRSPSLKVNEPRSSNRAGKSLHKRAGRWLEEPKLEHAIILRATEIANRAFQRAARAREVIAALTDKERKILERTYSRDLSSAVATILRLLLARKAIFFLGKFGTRRYYGVPSVIDPKTACLSTYESRRRLVLEIVRQAVTEMKRAVRNVDVLKYAAHSTEAVNLSPALISQNILSLKETGELRIVGSVRGCKGNNLYLPADLDLADYSIPLIPTWLEEVACTFTELWGERVRQASTEGKKLRPLSTGEVRARLRESSIYQENFSDPMILVNAMQQLAKTRHPIVRKLKRPGQKANLWVPTGVCDSDLSAGDSFINDIERIREAVRRAEKALARPVTLRDVQYQIEQDYCLRPVGSSTLKSILSDAARRQATSGKNGGGRRRANQHIERVGKVADVAYYSTSRTPEVEVFIQFERLKLHWSTMRVAEELGALIHCSLPTVAVGRVTLALTETVNLVRILSKFRTGGHLNCEQRQTADELFDQMTEAADFARGWLKAHAKECSRLPQSINTAVPGWTADELVEVIRPLYPRSHNLPRNSKIVCLMYNAIRRIPNPEYVNRFSTNQLMASEYLFDRTDALIYAAKEWGGHECCLQATIASNELGLLRDHHFVLPALKYEDFNSRLAAVACLAFLWSDASKKCLRRVAISDLDPGVRQSALWAYGFSGAADAQAILASRSKEDKDNRVRAFSHELLQVSQDSWWSL